MAEEYQLSAAELATVNQLRAALERAQSVAEVKDIRDAASVCVKALRVRNAALAVRNEYGVIQLDAERIIGRYLVENVDHQGGSPNTVLGLPDGVTWMQSSRYQLLAEVPEKDYREGVKALIHRGEEVTQAWLLRLAKELRKQRERQRLAEVGKNVLLPDNLQLIHADFRQHLPTLPDESFDLILTDPPYGEEFLPLWNDLAREAARLLKPTGLLLAYSGHMFMDDVLHIVGQCLSLHWCIAVQHTHGQHRIWDVKVWNSWKPVFVWRKHEPQHEWFTDFLDEGAADAKAVHDWSQPMAQARSLVRAFSPEGGRVLDPMCGAGTIPIAAASLNRCALGVEIDLTTLNAAKGRFHETSP